MSEVLQITSPSVSKAQKREYDNINELPDEVLISILARMPMKEAARTSVLSRRWKKLWTSHPYLVFDGSNSLRGIHYRSEQVLESEQFKYLNWVNDVLESHHDATIDEFKIRFYLDQCYQSDIDDWVRFAFGKKVQRFELDLSSSRVISHVQDSGYELCSHTLHFQTPLSLTSLVLKQVRVSGEVLENLLSNSPFLERLCIGASTSLVHLRLAGPSLCLTYLEITACARMKSLELDAPNLLSLKYSGQNIEIHFIEVPNLSELFIGGMFVETCTRSYLLPLVPTFASQLQKLVLEMRVDERKMKLFEYPILSQLKELELQVRARDHDSLLCLTSLINASPSLNRLSLELSWSKSYTRRRVMKVKRHHYNLKEVEIRGFVGGMVDTEFCIYLVENAIMLEKMSIDPFTKNEKGGENCFKAERARAARVRAEDLRSKYGVEYKLVIL
ncbi:hypothetical protein Gogos_010318 [Gossypium gossypioides]|uniref:F-box domain-containing protein n=1 Tax=Gossypium gossypioides TaxID=34282 RepID=A0A7J9BKX2_GOSGO|nr:hypothetical protein [Gossypium gossypioides]